MMENKNKCKLDGQECFYVRVYNENMTMKKLQAQNTELKEIITDMLSYEDQPGKFYVPIELVDRMKKAITE